MTKNAALNLAVSILKRWAREYYGNGAKHNPDKKHEYDRIYEAISILEGLREEKK